MNPDLLLQALVMQRLQQHPLAPIIGPGPVPGPVNHPRQRGTGRPPHGVRPQTVPTEFVYTPYPTRR